MKPTTDQLRAFRARHGLTRAQLGEHAGLKDIAKYLGGQSPRQMSEGAWLMLVGRVCEPDALARLQEAAEREAQSSIGTSSASQ